MSTYRIHPNNIQLTVYYTDALDEVEIEGDEGSVYVSGDDLLGLIDILKEIAVEVVE